MIDIKNSSTAELVKFYNANSGRPAIKKFRDRADAEKRVASLAPKTPTPAPAPAPPLELVPPTPKAKAEKPPKPAYKAFTVAPKEDGSIRKVRATSRIAGIIDLLAKGCTYDDIVKLTPPKGNTRGMLRWQLAQTVGYGYSCDANGHMQLLYPKGMRAPLAHATREELV